MAEAEWEVFPSGVRRVEVDPSDDVVIIRVTDNVGRLHVYAVTAVSRGRLLPPLLQTEKIA